MFRNSIVDRWLSIGEKTYDMFFLQPSVTFYLFKKQKKLTLKEHATNYKEYLEGALIYKQY